MPVPRPPAEARTDTWPPSRTYPVDPRAPACLSRRKGPTSLPGTESEQHHISNRVELAWRVRWRLSRRQHGPSMESPYKTIACRGRIADAWVTAIGLDPTTYDTHTMRRTKASLIYRRTKNLRAVQLLRGHTKLESTVRYLGIEVDDALEMAEQTEV